MIEGSKYIDLNINFYTIHFNGKIHNLVRNVIPIIVTQYNRYIGHVYKFYQLNQNTSYDFIRILYILIFRINKIFNQISNWKISDIVSIVNYADKIKYIDRLEFIKSRPDVLQNVIIRNDLDYAITILKYYHELSTHLELDQLDLSKVKLRSDGVVEFVESFIEKYPFEYFIPYRLIYNGGLQYILKYDPYLLCKYVNNISSFKDMFAIVNLETKSIILKTPFFFENSYLHPAWDNEAIVIELLKYYLESPC